MKLQLFLINNIPTFLSNCPSSIDVIHNNHSSVVESSYNKNSSSPYQSFHQQSSNHNNCIFMWQVLHMGIRKKKLNFNINKIQFPLLPCTCTVTTLLRLNNIPLWHDFIYSPWYTSGRANKCYLIPLLILLVGCSYYFAILLCQPQFSILIEMNTV